MKSVLPFFQSVLFATVGLRPMDLGRKEKDIAAYLPHHVW